MFDWEQVITYVKVHLSRENQVEERNRGSKKKSKGEGGKE